MPKCPDNTNCPSNTRCVQTGATKFECRPTGGGTASQPLGSVYGKGTAGTSPTGNGARGLKLPKRPRATGSGTLSGGPSGTGSGSVELQRLPAGTSILDNAKTRFNEIFKGIGENKDKVVMIGGVVGLSLLALYMVRKVT